MEGIVFKKNREVILHQMMDASLLFVFSTPKEDVKYDVDRNYYYVSGNFEYENIVVLYKKGQEIKEMIFIHRYDEVKAKWVGAPLSKDKVAEQSGFKDIYYLDEFDEIISNYILEISKL